MTDAEIVAKVVNRQAQGMRLRDGTEVNRIETKPGRFNVAFYHKRGKKLTTGQIHQWQWMIRNLGYQICGYQDVTRYTDNIVELHFEEKT